MVDRGAGAARPRWLAQCRAEIQTSAEWLAVRSQLLLRLQEEVQKANVQHLSSLSEEAQMVVLAKVQPEVMMSLGYTTLISSADEVVGRHILREVEERAKHRHEPKAAAIVDTAAAGASLLLQGWPQAKAGCGALMNVADVPPGLRRELWRSWLARREVAVEFEVAARGGQPHLSLQHQLLALVRPSALHPAAAAAATAAALTGSFRCT